MTGRLANKIAIVTGASSGIGRATAILFAREGATVVCSDINETPPPIGSSNGESTTVSPTHVEIQASGDKAIFVSCDTSSAAQVEALVGTTVERFGRLDIMFNNAGVGPEVDLAPNAAIWQADEGIFDRTMAVNVKGIFLGCKYAAAQMKNQEPLVGGEGGDRGWIVNTSSALGLRGWEGMPAYVTSKHAVIGITRAAALDCARFNIHVNAVSPGFVDTGITHNFLSADGMEDVVNQFHPLKGMGKAEDVARAVLFLVSEDAAWVTAQTLSIDGGLMAR